MKVLLLAKETVADFTLRDDQEKFDNYMGAWRAYADEMNAITIGGAALAPPSVATVVSVRDGERRVEDGPFADAKEQLGGFFLIETPSMDEAVSWARKCPAAQTGHVEVRVVPSLAEHAK